MGESRLKHSPKYQMKHRLTGAAVIIIGTLSVILLVLREPARMPGSEGATNEVVTETEVFQSNLVPLNVSAVNLNEQGADPGENSSQSRRQVTENATVSPEEYHAETGGGKERPDASDGIQGGWSVRVGTFAKQENVERITKLLGENGFDARRTRVPTTSGEAIRVWLGPYAKRETADTVNAKLQALRGEKGYITKNEP